MIFKKSVGIDISDRTIEVVELSSFGSKIKIKNSGRVSIPPGIVDRGKIIEKKQLADILKKVLNKSQPSRIKPRNIIFGLPESRVYTRIFELGSHEKEKRHDLILKEAIGSIPLKEDDLLFTYSVLSEKNEKVEIILVGVSKNIFKEWETFFKELKFKVKAFDIETLANIRGIFPKKPESPTVVVDFGTILSTITIVDKSGLRYVYSTEIGGETITKAEAKSAGISLTDAETKKIAEGLLEKDAKMASSLLVSLKPFINDIKSSIEYYKKKSGENVKEIVLIGGSSKLKGLVSRLTQELKLPVKLGEPYLKNSKTTLEFAEAIGLALRGFLRKQDEKDPIIQIRESVSRLGFPIGEIPAKTKGTKAYILTNPMESARLKKLNFQMTTLLFIIILGIGVFITAYWFRDSQRSKRELSFQGVLQNKEYTYKFEVEALLETDFRKYSDNRIQGRFIENDVSISKGDAAIEESKKAAEETLVEGEVLWNKPIQEVVSENGEKTTFRWISYFEDGANRLLASSVEGVVDDYTFSSIKKVELVETSTSGEFKMLGEVVISVKNQLDANLQTNLRKDDSDQIEKQSLIESLLNPLTELNVEETTETQN